MMRGVCRALAVVAVAVTALCTYAQNAATHDAMHSLTASQRQPVYVVPATAWEATSPLGLREEVAVDTLEHNYYQRSVPSTITSAYACTGNLGTQGINMIYIDRPLISDFFLQDAMRAWLPYLDNHTFYNTPWPRTFVSYNTGGSRDNSQDRLQTVFTGNFNRRTQFGANLDYLYSKGSYANQSTKHTNWGFSGSYLGDRYEFQGSWYHYNMLNKENGGITNDLYITDPAKLQGGVSTINPTSIPTNLTAATNRTKGGELFLNHRYKIGYWHEERDSVDTDSIVSRTYIPVSSVIWTLGYREASKKFIDTNAQENNKFWKDTYIVPGLTNETTSYWSLTNTVGLSLLEGFHKYAKFGLAAYATYELRDFTQAADTFDLSDQRLTPLPEYYGKIAPHHRQSLAWVGAQLTKQHGSILTYAATAEIGVLGDAIGEIKARGNVSTHIPLLGDTVTLTGYGSLYNTTAPYLLCNYRSNHFVWHNDFGKQRRLRVGGILQIPQSGTAINVGTETLQNLLYFGDDGRPAQHADAVQVFSATLDQRLSVGILHWDNRITYQTTTDSYVLPLPQLAVKSNLYIQCHIATLSLQLGVDCDYYTRYYAPAYQPATATFHNQHEVKCGNYPFMTAYANMKLGRTRFYVMMTHVNQGMVGGNEYFSIPHYPLNPRRLQMGLSVDFWD